MQTIAIVGGGFSGTLTAVNLARFTHIPLRILLINREYPIGRGIAYSTKQHEHLLNVAARNMSALADHPNHFVDWLRTRHEYQDLAESVLRETFVPRRVYGDYLRSLLQAYAVPITHRDDIQIDFVTDDIEGVRPESGEVILEARSGQTFRAHKVVLATGNQKPADFIDEGFVFQHDRFIANPWTEWESKLPDPSETVVLLGTGLTTVDAIVTLERCGWRGQIFAVSRNGLMPQSHFRGIEYPDFPPTDPAKLGLEGLVGLMEEHCRRLREIGANPGIVVDKLRPFTQRIWKNLTLDEKEIFVRKYSARWNATRHRIAQSIHQQVTRAVDDGRLRIVTGNVKKLAAAGSRIHVSVEGSNGANIVLDAGFVVNGTGPRRRFSETDNPLIHNLLSGRQIQLDSMDMGLEVDDNFRAIDGQGKVSNNIYAIGPILKGSLWETIAVPELRGQTLRVAQSILQQVGGDKPITAPWPVQFEFETIEYCI